MPRKKLLKIVPVRTKLPLKIPPAPLGCLRRQPSGAGGVKKKRRAKISKKRGKLLKIIN
jgi:hypothetical protein